MSSAAACASGCSSRWPSPATPNSSLPTRPTTALDVTIQAQVIDVLKSLQRSRGPPDPHHPRSERGGPYGRHGVRDVLRPDCGKAPLRELFHRPLHPYTRGLLAAVPSLTAERRRFIQIPDAVPSPPAQAGRLHLPSRCALCTEQCRNTLPPLADAGDGRLVRCWRPGRMDGRRRGRRRNSIKDGAGMNEPQKQTGGPLVRVEDLSVHFPVRGGVPFGKKKKCGRCPTCPFVSPEAKPSAWWGIRLRKKHSGKRYPRDGEADRRPGAVQGPRRPRPLRPGACGSSAGICR